MSPISRKHLENKLDDPVSDGNHIRMILAVEGKGRECEKATGKRCWNGKRIFTISGEAIMLRNKKSTLETVGFATR